MVVDHAKCRRDYPELAKSVDNMITLCPNCHALKDILKSRARQESIHRE